jgi:hypothetical protein
MPHHPRRHQGTGDHVVNLLGGHAFEVHGDGRVDVNHACHVAADSPRPAFPPRRSRHTRFIRPRPPCSAATATSWPLTGLPEPTLGEVGGRGTPHPASSSLSFGVRPAELRATFKAARRKDREDTDTAKALPNSRPGRG